MPAGIRSARTMHGVPWALVLGGPLQTRKTSVMVADLIREGILAGRLRPGDRLKEDVLAKELAVSRTPVREAIAEVF